MHGLVHVPSTGYQPRSLLKPMTLCRAQLTQLYKAPSLLGSLTANREKGDMGDAGVGEIEEHSREHLTQPWLSQKRHLREGTCSSESSHTISLFLSFSPPLLFLLNMGILRHREFNFSLPVSETSFVKERENLYTAT